MFLFIAVWGDDSIFGHYLKYSVLYKTD